MSKRKVIMSSQFKRDLRKQYLLLVTEEWAEVFGLLSKGKALPEKYLDHQLTGNLNAYRECHILNDFLLMYSNDDEELHLVRLGTHSELFG